MSGNIFNGIDDELRKDAGCTTELDYIEQSSWLLFEISRCLEKRETNALLKGKPTIEFYQKSTAGTIGLQKRW